MTKNIITQKERTIVLKKQISPAPIYSRIISTYIDMFLFSVISNYTFNKIFIKLQEMIFNSKEANNNMLQDQINNTIHNNFHQMSPLSKLDNLGELIIVILINYTTNLFLLGAYFCFFWHKFGSTPGKMLLSIRVVNQENIDKKITFTQCIKRFLGYFIAMFSIFWRIFYLKSSKAQLFHDKISGTEVIKN